VSGLRLDRIVKRFGRREAVRGVSLEVADGEFVVFVGPSGCGKTTTLNIIAGLESPTEGDVWIGADRVTDWEPRDRNLGMVFQSLALFPHMSVFDNIAFPLRLKGVAAGEVVERVRAVAETVKVDHLLGQRPATLSGGEAQRVALARTIVVKPAVFLMDEPLSSLDAKLRVDMRTELKRLHASLGATFVYVTHDQAEAMTMADRIVVMHQGRVEQVGPPLAIYGDPATRFVAGFFGVPSMNFIDGRLTGDAGATVFEAPSLRLSQPAGGPAAAGPATLGIRPEHVRLTGPGEGHPAVVNLTEPLGDGTLVFLDYGGPGSLVAKVDAEEKVAVGDRRGFAFRGDRVLFFDTASGARLRHPSPG
jgi:ABC-type sugar transport system ATPase subunit